MTMNAKTLVHGVAVLSLLVAGAACVDDTGKGEETGFADGKADGFEGLESHDIPLPDLDGSVFAFDDEVRAHEFMFHLDENEDVTIATGAADDPFNEGESIDTVLYLYKLRDSGTWGRFIRKNDDADDTNFSLIVDSLEPGDYRVVAKAFDETVVGLFSISMGCDDGDCGPQATSSTLTGLARADECLMHAGNCALSELPRYDGAVGPAQAQTLLDECLAAAGSDCVDACDAAPELAHTCDLIIDSLSNFADTSRECLVEMASCLDSCEGYSGLGYSDDNEFLHTPTCWDGHQGSSSSATGNCSNYAYGLDVCGGDSYNAGTVEACYALCESTEGAWDEGPFDGCFEDCDWESRGHTW